MAFIQNMKISYLSRKHWNVMQLSVIQFLSTLCFTFIHIDIWKVVFYEQCFQNRIGHRQILAWPRDNFTVIVTQVSATIADTHQFRFEANIDVIYDIGTIFNDAGAKIQVDTRVVVWRFTRYPWLHDIRAFENTLQGT